MYKENITPKKIPKKVAEVPIITPTKKKIFIIDLFSTPIKKTNEKKRVTSCSRI